MVLSKKYKINLSLFSRRNDNNTNTNKFIYDLKDEELPTYLNQNELLLFLTHNANKQEFKFNYTPKFIIKNEKDQKINGFVLSNYQIIPIKEINYNKQKHKYTFFENSKIIEVEKKLALQNTHKKHDLSVKNYKKIVFKKISNNKFTLIKNKKKINLINEVYNELINLFYKIIYLRLLIIICLQKIYKIMKKQFLGLYYIQMQLLLSNLFPLFL